MAYYEYRVVPAPTATPRIKGVKGTSNLFALGLEEALNAEGQDAWEYQRSETLTVSSKQGLFRKAVSETVTVMIYRRWVETAELPQPVLRHATEPRDEPQTPEDLAGELEPPRRHADNHGEPRPPTSLSASRRPEGDLRPVPAPARD